MRKPLIVTASAIAVVTIALTAGYWFMTGGSPERETPTWLTARPIAHKGLWAEGGERPENSLAAFDAARQVAMPIELDVQLSSDGEVVVFHDYELSRMTDYQGDLATMKVAELKDIDLDGGIETIPTLTQVLNLVDGEVPLFVEIKNEGEIGRLEDEVSRMLSEYDGPVAVMSFNPYSLRRVASKAPSIPRGQLASAFEGEDLAWYEVLLLRNLMMNWTSKPDFIAYDIKELPNLTTTVQKWRGRPLLGWTAQTPAERLDAQELCDQVICDEPALR